MHLYISDDGTAWDLDKIWGLWVDGNRIIAKFGSDSSVDAESHVPTIYLGQDQA